MFSLTKENLPKPISVFQAIASMPKLETGTGEFEMDYDFKSISAYDKLMQREIDFKQFYELVKTENKHKINQLHQLPSLFPIIE